MSNTSRDLVLEVSLIESHVIWIMSHPFIAVFETISPEVPFGLVPQENTIFGAVTETYDALRGPLMGRDILVRGEVTLAVQHCLLARQGVNFEDIERIVSHEQVRFHHLSLRVCTNVYARRLLASVPASSRSVSRMRPWRRSHRLPPPPSRYWKMTKRIYTLLLLDRRYVKNYLTASRSFRKVFKIPIVCMPFVGRIIRS